VQFRADCAAKLNKLTLLDPCGDVAGGGAEGVGGQARSLRS
jgi:hypothetical protein